MSNHFVRNVLPGAVLARGLSDRLAAGIEDARGSWMPEGVTTNHPTFVYGHLSIYPDRLFTLYDRPDLAKPDQRYEDLFSPYAECAHDPECGKYPTFKEAYARYAERTDAVIEFLRGVDDDTCEEELPNEAQRARFPTKGALATFLLQAHTMMHLGQVSAWRRMMGLGEAMERPKPPGATKG